MLKAETLKIHCDICGKKVPREKACQVALIFGAYTPGKDGKKVERNEVCEDCANHLQNLMTCPPKEEESPKDEKLEKPKKSNKYGNAFRCVTVARLRAGMSQKELAQTMFYDKHAISSWEQGKNRPNWEELYKVLPELPEIRANGCAAYCENPTYCQHGDGSCYYAKGYCSKGKKREDPDATA